MPDLDAELPHCQPGALTDRYGLVVQGILAALAFLSLVIKRFLEPRTERRPWVIWFFDTSKQAAGAGVIHLINVFLADMFQGDPCTWYVVSFLLDSSLGLFLIYVCVKLVSCVAAWKDWPTLRFGEYGSPPGCRPWFHQCLAFLGITIFEKITVTLVIQFEFWRGVRKVILSPIRSPKLEVTIVMLVIPFVVNTLMFWIVDNFTKRKVGRNRSFSLGKTSPEKPDQNHNIVEVNELEKLLDDKFEEVDLESGQPSPSFITDNHQSLFLRHNSS